MASAHPPDTRFGHRACAAGCGLLEAVANLTVARERDPLEAALAIEIFSLFDIDEIALHRTVEHDGAVRLAERLRLDRDGLRQAPDHETGDTPILASREEWAQCAALEVATRTETGRGTLQTFPLLSESGVVGILEVTTAQPMTATQMQLVSGMLTVFRNHLSLLVDSQSDTLTGLLNRKTFDSRFMRLVEPTGIEQQGPDLLWQRRRRPRQDGQHQWLAIADIDNFKRINDRFGHLYGDEVLLLMTRIMRNTFRLRDKLFRFGGEEFVVLLDRTEPENAARVFERFRQAVAGFEFPQLGQVTISIGYTRICLDDAPSSAIERADEALYYAKAQGRNLVYAHETLAAIGQVPEKVSHSNDVELF